MPIIAKHLASDRLEYCECRIAHWIGTALDAVVYPNTGWIKYKVMDLEHNRCVYETNYLDAAIDEYNKFNSQL